MASRWLFKEEPECYSFVDLEREGHTVWDGISNALALIHLRKVQAGDSIFCYHTGKEKAVVGVMEAISLPYADPKENNPKLAVVDVKFVRKFARPVTLSELKADSTFADWELLKISRLSVMPVPDLIWKKIEALAAKPAKGTSAKGK
jgi:predicted RNA-binding protein with PUA-like domain